MAVSLIGRRVLTHHVTKQVHCELGPFCFGDGEKEVWDAMHRFAIPFLKHTPMEIFCWFKGWKGKMEEKNTSFKDKAISLYQLLNAIRPELDKITQDMPFNEALRGYWSF